VQAVIAQSGWSYGVPESDYGIDIEVKYVREIGGKYKSTGHALEIQIKSTTQPYIRDNELIFDLDVAAFNELANPTRGANAILVVYCMPSADSDWLAVSREQIVLRNCGYWVCLRGLEASGNQATKRVSIPLSQVFDADALGEMMEKVYGGEWIR